MPLYTKYRIFSFLRDLYPFFSFSEKKYLIINLINLIKSLLFKRNVIFFLSGNVINCSYSELVREVYPNEHYKKSLLIGRVFSNSVDYLKLGVKFRNKNVMDIGAWIGDTILLFHKLGAKNIIAYDPIDENVKFANKIIKKFNIRCKIYKAAVCDRDKLFTFYTDEKTCTVGDLNILDNKKNVGKNKITVKCVSWENVIKKAIKNKIDIIKIDCEGCEKFLIFVSDKIIERIPEWIIECHGMEVAKIVYKKFISCNFSLKGIFSGNPYYIILYFSKS